MTAKFENINKKKLNFSLIKLKEQLQLYFMKSVQHKKNQNSSDRDINKSKSSSFKRKNLFKSVCDDQKESEQWCDN